tara:strand:- start:317 stop:751 length:435 start_codon:yes stop_codon:yes gene_type:complete
MAVRILVVGDGGVGKSSWVARLSGNEVDRKYIPTEGVSSVVVGDMEIDDVGGQFHSFDLGNKEYDLVVVMFDVGSRQSFKNSGWWHSKVIERVGPGGSIVLCGAKHDRTDRKVTDEEMLEVPEDYARVCTISSKTGNNVQSPFQ